ncbi:hypothetical protein FBUS_10232 [Fasciolopsis buskii]|uniref:Uncharacterized protein n=1 Tax=Fasciolopsis buskii TaxID=27845 RepID=A0A8E0VIU9_9TREM|nr:hypothetical protein FBUS_10232 [Fasciolopsis buski]
MYPNPNRTSQLFITKIVKLVKLEYRDGLSVLSSSIPSLEERNSMLTESGVMIGRQAENDDHRPVVPDVCPIIRDEADTVPDVSRSEEKENNELLAEIKLAVSNMDSHISKNQPSTKANSMENKQGKLLDTDSETGLSVAVATGSRGPGMHQFRQLILHLIPAPPSYEENLKIWAEVYCKTCGTDSRAARDELRPTDRIIGLDGSFLLAVAAHRTLLESVEMIESNRTEMYIGSSDPPKPVCLTVVP